MDVRKAFGNTESTLELSIRKYRFDRNPWTSIRQRQRYKLQVFMALTGAGNRPPIVESESVELQHAGRERFKILKAEHCLLILEGTCND